MNKKATVATKEVAEQKVSFDKKAFFQQMSKAFAKSTVVDVVADTENEKTLDKPEYEYIHFYKKGTTKNLFQLYVKNKDCKFVVGLSLKDLLKQGKNYTVTPVEKTRNGEKKAVCIRVTCAHEDAQAVAETIVAAYESRAIEAVEVPEKKAPAAKKASAKTKVAKKGA